MAHKVLSAMRSQFGGHAEVNAVEPEDAACRRTEQQMIAEQQPIADALVLFGATGDLAKRKLFPALYHLEHTAC